MEDPPQEKNKKLDQQQEQAFTEEELQAIEQNKIKKQQQEQLRRQQEPDTIIYQGSQIFQGRAQEPQLFQFRQQEPLFQRRQQQIQEQQKEDQEEQDQEEEDQEEEQPVIKKRKKISQRRQQQLQEQQEEEERLQQEEERLQQEEERKAIEEADRQEREYIIQKNKRLKKEQDQQQNVNLVGQLNIQRFEQPQQEQQEQQEQWKIRKQTDIQPSNIFVFRELYSNYFNLIDNYPQKQDYEKKENFVFHQFLPLKQSLLGIKRDQIRLQQQEIRINIGDFAEVILGVRRYQSIIQFGQQCRAFANQIQEIYLNFDRRGISRQNQQEQADLFKQATQLFSEKLNNFVSVLLKNIRGNLSNRKLIQSQWEGQVINYALLNAPVGVQNRVSTNDFFGEKADQFINLSEFLLNQFREDYMIYQKYLNPGYRQRVDIQSVYGQILQVVADQGDYVQLKKINNYFLFIEGRVNYSPLEQWPPIINIQQDNERQTKNQYDMSSDSFAMSIFSGIPQHYLCFIVFILRLLSEDYIDQFEYGQDIALIFFPRVKKQQIFYLRATDQDNQLVNLADTGEDQYILRPNREGDPEIVKEYYSYTSCLYLLACGLKLAKFSFTSFQQGLNVDIQKFKMLRFDDQIDVPPALLPLTNQIRRENSQEREQEKRDDPKESFYIVTKNMQQCLGLIQLHAEKADPDDQQMIFVKNNAQDDIVHNDEQYNIQAIANEVAHTMTILIKYLKSNAQEKKRGGISTGKTKLKFKQEFAGANDFRDLADYYFESKSIQIVLKVQQLLQSSTQNFAVDQNLFSTRTRIIPSPVILYIEDVAVADTVQSMEVFDNESIKLVLILSILFRDIIRKITDPTFKDINSINLADDNIRDRALFSPNLIGNIFTAIYGRAYAINADLFKRQVLRSQRQRRIITQLYSRVSIFYSMSEFRQHMVDKYYQDNPSFNNDWVRILNQCIRQQRLNQANLDEAEEEGGFDLNYSDGILEAVNGHIEHDENVKILALLGIRVPQLLIQTISTVEDSAYTAFQSIISRLHNYKMFITFNNFIIQQRARNIGSRVAQNIVARGSNLMLAAQQREGFIGPNFLLDPQNQNRLAFLDIQPGFFLDQPGYNRQQAYNDRLQIINNLKNLYTPIYPADQNAYKTFYSKQFWPQFMLSKTLISNRLVENFCPQFTCIVHVYIQLVLKCMEACGGRNTCMSINISQINFLECFYNDIEILFNKDISLTVSTHIQLLHQYQFALLASISQFTDKVIKFLTKNNLPIYRVNLEFFAYYPDKENYFRQYINVIYPPDIEIYIIGFRSHLELVQGKENMSYIQQQAKYWLKKQYPFSTKTKQPSYLAYKYVENRIDRDNLIFKDRKKVYDNKIKQLESTIFCFFDIETTSSHDKFNSMTPYLCVFNFCAIQQNMQQIIDEIEVYLESGGVNFRQHQIEQKQSKYFYIEKTQYNEAVASQFINILNTVKQFCEEKEVKIYVTAHNGSRFDTVILLKEIFLVWGEEVELLGNFTNAKIVKVGQSLQFVDSLLMTQLGSLNAGCGPKGLNLNLEKLPNEDIKHIETMQEYLDKSDESKDNILIYCIQDVYMMKMMIIEFNFLMHKIAVTIFNQIFQNIQSEEKSICNEENYLRQTLFLQPTLPSMAFFIVCKLCIGKDFLLAHLDSSNFISYILVRAQYYGGFTQVFNCKQFDHVKYYDANSMYPHKLTQTMPCGFSNEIIMIPERQINNFNDINPHSLYGISWYKVGQRQLYEGQLGLFLHRDNKTFLGKLNQNDCGTFQLLEFGDKDARFTQHEVNQTILASSKHKTIEHVFKIVFGLEILVAKQLIPDFQYNVIFVNQALPQEKYQQQPVLYQPFKQSIQFLYKERLAAKREKQSGLDKVLKLIINGSYGCMAQNPNPISKYFKFPENESDPSYQATYNYIQQSIEKLFQDTEQNEKKKYEIIDRMVQYQEHKNVYQAYLAGSYKINKIDEINMINVKIPVGVTPQTEKQLSVPFAAFVTTLARLHLLSMMYKITEIGSKIQRNPQLAPQILYSDTDSIIFYIRKEDLDKFLKKIEGQQLYIVKYQGLIYQEIFKFDEEELGAMKDEYGGDEIIKFQAFQKKVYLIDTKKKNEGMKMKGVQQKHMMLARDKILSALDEGKNNITLIQELFARKVHKIYIEEREYIISLKQRQIFDKQSGRRSVFKNIQEKRQFCDENL